MATRVRISVLSMGAGSSSEGSGKQPLDGDLEQENRGQWALVGHYLLTYHWMRLESDWKQRCLFIVITALKLHCDHAVSTCWWGPVKNWIQKTNSKQCQRKQGGLCRSLQIQSLWFYKIRTMKKIIRENQRRIYSRCVSDSNLMMPLSTAPLIYVDSLRLAWLGLQSYIFYHNENK